MSSAHDFVIMSVIMSLCPDCSLQLAALQLSSGDRIHRHACGVHSVGRLSYRRHGMRTTRPTKPLRRSGAAFLLPAAGLLLGMVASALLSPHPASAFDLRFPGGRSLSYQGGVLRINLSQPAVPLPPAPPRTATVRSEVLAGIEVRDTGTGRGWGAFATAPLGEGTFLGWYEGEVVKGREALDEAILRRRRGEGGDGDGGRGKGKGGAGDYVLSLDGGATFIDGFVRAAERSTFSPCHLNHEDGGNDGCNCVRVLDGDAAGVAFFTARDVSVGEELCFDYGNKFWEGRVGEKL